MEVPVNKFDYQQATDMNEASVLVSDNDRAQFVAGGTNVIDLWKYNVTNPALLVDINRIKENRTIEEIEGGGIRLGALVSNADTAYHPLIEGRYPLLSRSILAGASAQIRNMATNGGNLMQRTRCYYFYDAEVPCNKRDPGSGCSAINGYNRMHAILGHSEHCIAVFPSDMCIALAALEGVVNVSDANGNRAIPIEHFHRLPESKPEVDTILNHGEIIASIDLPAKGFSSNYSYLKIRDRNSYAFALVSVATGLELEGDIIREARIALGGIAHKPWRVKEAEEALRGKPATETTFEEAAKIILAGAQGFKYTEFKIELAKRAIVKNGMIALQPELQKPGAQP